VPPPVPALPFARCALCECCRSAGFLGRDVHGPSKFVCGQLIASHPEQKAGAKSTIALSSAATFIIAPLPLCPPLSPSLSPSARSLPLRRTPSPLFLCFCISRPAPGKPLLDQVNARPCTDPYQQRRLLRHPATARFNHFAELSRFSSIDSASICFKPTKAFATSHLQRTCELPRASRCPDCQHPTTAPPLSLLHLPYPVTSSTPGPSGWLALLTVPDPLPSTFTHSVRA
jgi:hypothetical protein